MIWCCPWPVDKSRYNIALLAPAGYPHAMAFREVAVLLVASFESLGIPATFMLNNLDPAATNVILGYHLIQTPSTLRGIRYIPYQLEQLDSESPFVTERAMEVLRNATEVWDYSPRNMAHLASKGVKAKLLPLGYHEKLRLIPQLPESQQDIDVLHYGTLNPRRQRVLEQLQKVCRLVHVDCLYGEARDALIARAKLVLSIHFYESKLPAQVRISYLLNNGKAVLAEAAGDGVDDPFQGMVGAASYDQLVATALELLRDGARREELAANGLVGFQQRGMAEYLQAVP